jgi:SHAQKYF class myb-like DNA-binding protein
MLFFIGVLNHAIYAVATPKQIRDMMKVDGLTNDEVKSHLQVCS